MQKLNQTVLISGVLAGICAAFLTLGATAQSSFSFLLYAGSAMPILIAGMGWGNRAAIVAIITTAIIGALVMSPLFALTIAIFTLIPAGFRISPIWRARLPKSAARMICLPGIRSPASCCTCAFWFRSPSSFLAG